ncbi:MAG: hypothetical protein ACOZDD_13360 [Bacteroidota bacterium]
MDQLIQNRDGDFLRYSLGYDGLKMSTCIEDVYQTATYRYEDIEFNEVITERKPSRLRVILFFSVMINSGFLLFFGSASLTRLAGTPVINVAPATLLLVLLVIWGRRLLVSRLEKSLVGPMKVTFYYGRKERANVDAFILNIREKQREMMRKKYMRIDKYLPVEEQERRFCWMYDHEFITQSELEVLVEEAENLRTEKGNKI